MNWSDLRSYIPVDWPVVSIVVLLLGGLIAVWWDEAHHHGGRRRTPKPAHPRICSHCGEGLDSIEESIESGRYPFLCPACFYRYDNGKGGDTAA
jgi:hypothetical protein